MSSDPASRSDGRGERPVTHGDRVLWLSVDLDLLHLLLYLLQLHLLLPLLCQLLDLGHSHRCLLLLAVVVGVDRVPLSRVGAILRLRAVERHYGVLDVLFGLLRYEARVQEERRMVLG